MEEECVVNVVEENVTVFFVDFSKCVAGKSCVAKNLHYRIHSSFWNRFKWHEKLRMRIWIWLSGPSILEIVEDRGMV
jgi:hypothetical protein